MKKPAPRFWPNRLRNWPYAKGSFFVVKNSDGVPPPPVETFFILLESGDLMLQENGDAILTELAP